MTLNQIRNLGLCAPDRLRAELEGISRQNLADKAASLRAPRSSDPVLVTTTTALGLLGRRVLVIDAEKAKLELLLGGIVVSTAPRLLRSSASASTQQPRCLSPPATAR